METEKVEGADNSATETTPAPEMDLAGLAASLKSEPAPAPEAPAQEATPAEVDEYLNPPSALKPEYKAEWAKLPKNWRQEFYRRETDFHKGIEPYKGGHSKWEKLEKEVLSPYAARIQSSGLPPERFVQEFLALDHALTNGTPQQKAQAFAAFQQYYGLGTPPGQQQTQQQQLDPTVQRLQDELAQIKGTLTQDLTVRQQREQQEALESINAFKTDPKNIYFEDVKDDMAALLSTGRAKDLADAYDKACRLNPAVFAATAKQQREAEEKQRIEDAKRKTADAKRAGFDVQAQGAAVPGAKRKSIREEMADRLGVQLSN